MTESEPPHLNIDTSWSEMDDLDICWGVGHGRSLEETADFLCRTACRSHLIEKRRKGYAGHFRNMACSR
jgi:hypothetical protein